MKSIIESRREQYDSVLVRSFPVPIGWIKPVVALLFLVGMLLILDRVQHDTVLTLSDTRPLAQIAAVVLGGVAIWGIISAGLSLRHHHRQIAWRMSFRMLGWVGFAGSLLSLAFFITQPDDAPGLPLGGAVRSVESLIPLVLGIQAAFLLSPDDEPGIEVLLACPRHISWALLERLTVLFLSQAVLAVLGVIASMLITGDSDVLVTFARWIPAALFFSGMSVYVTLASRQPAFSVALTGILWFVFGFMGMTLLPGQPMFWPLSLVQPFMWAVHPYLQPGFLSASDWWLNRALVTAIGIGFIMLAVRQLRDEERVLLGGQKARKQSKGEG